jgi:hypothetical protein
MSLQVFEGLLQKSELIVVIFVGYKIHEIGLEVLGELKAFGLVNSS